MSVSARINLVMVALSGTNLAISLLHCFSLPTCSMLFVELMVVYEAVNLCFNKDFKKIWLEVDALLIIAFLLLKMGNIY